MLYTILISIVFIAELIIATASIQNLLRFDKMLIDVNDTVIAANPEIKDICELVRKISEQSIIFAENFAKKIKEQEEESEYRILSKILTAILIWKINKKFKHSKFSKIISKGLKVLKKVI